MLNKRHGRKNRFLVVIFADIQFAGSKLEDFLERIDGVPQVVDRSEGAVDLAPLVRGSRDENAGIFVAGRYFDIGESLAVLEPLVVGRLNVLDQAIFLKKGIDFRVTFEKVDVDDLCRHAGDVGAARGDEIR